MALEIERKFLLKNDSWRDLCQKGKKYIQGYLTGSELASVRVRLEDDKAFLNIKSMTYDIVRTEYEYSIPNDDAVEMLEKLCTKPLISKMRYDVLINNKKWEIDVFEGDNEGLIVAEIELESENEKIELPDFIAEEVSDDSRYYNINLVEHPYCKW
ncbi:MAG: CYTH domain-containing protein [Gammaproteobacteria bacterium]